ncbi:MAG: hypothetical protein IJO59_02515 [Clostridia bacterium]|nr:hypothetical protein [Clostridia bacterium]
MKRKNLRLLWTILSLFLCLVLVACSPTAHEDDRPVPVADLIGKTVGEAKAVFGNDFEHVGYKGSSSMFYSDLGIELVLAGGWHDTLTDDLVLKYAVSGAANTPILGDITRHMTYPDLLSAIGEEVTLPEPTYVYSDMNDRMEYTLAFEYRGLQVKLLWLTDPQTTPFLEIVVWDPTLPYVQ